MSVRADVYASVRGHAWASGTTVVNLPISANSSGQTRTDRIVLRLDRSNWTVRAIPKEGTPGAGAPALTRQTGDTGVYEVPLALVTVLNGAAAVTVTRSELYVGTRSRACTSSTRNPNPTVSELAYETDTGRVRMWTGTSWVIIYEDSGIVNINSTLGAWSNEVDCVLQKRNGTVHLRLGSFKRLAGNLTAPVETRLPVLIPAACRHSSRDQYGFVMVNGSVGRYIIYATSNSGRGGQIYLVNKPAISAGDFVLPMSGMSWVVD
ncbi:hypothetical protein ACFV0C_37115 [Streptomyces sp. NPDC059568]|uniref:hypothetical protein n=1 Tax=Streptomyces sp. NPDC059568 TaxID=3346868 RepID=UPI0036C6B465